MSEKLLKQKKPFGKKELFILAFIVLVGLTGWWTVSNSLPHPLGNRLDYLGKEDFGGALVFGDSDRHSVYYYGTNMGEKEIKAYFKKASYNDKIQTGTVLGEAYAGNVLHFNSTSGDFTVTFYDGSDITRQKSNLNKTDKSNVISLTGTDYVSAKSSL